MQILHQGTGGRPSLVDTPALQTRLRASFFLHIYLVHQSLRRMPEM